jgi:hypothetical protein
MKYIRCFSKEKSDELVLKGFELLYEQNGVYYFNNNEELSLSVNFSKSDTFSENDVVYAKSLNF